MVLRNGVWKGMVTLTYPRELHDQPWERSKAQLNAFLQGLRRRRVSYLWVLELTQAGRIHYHVLVDRWVGKEDVARLWWGACGKVSVDHLAAGTRVEAIRNPLYVAKYLRKGCAPGALGRRWGASRGLLEASVLRTDWGGHRIGRKLLERRGVRVRTRRGYTVYGGAEYVRAIEVRHGRAAGARRGDEGAGGGDGGGRAKS